MGKKPAYTKPWVNSPALQEVGVIVHPCDPTTQIAEAGDLEDQGHPVCLVSGLPVLHEALSWGGKDLNTNKSFVALLATY